MKPMAHLLAALSMMATVILLLLAALAWAEMQNRLAINDTLNANIAEMARIDEVLTTSALLAATTGDMAYRERYYAHVDTLDSLLNVSIGLLESDRADAMLAQTRDANDWLVETEERALDAMVVGPSPLAYGWLRSADYARYKVEYTAGLNAAMGELEALAVAGVHRMKAVLARLSIIVAIAILCFARMILVAHAERRALDAERARFASMRTLLRTFMDLQNNLLNNMVYLRTKAAHALPFDDDDIRMIDAEIDRAKTRLSHLVDNGIGTPRDLGGIEVADPPRSAGSRMHDAA